MNTFTLSLDLDKEQGLPQLVTLRQGDKSGTQLVATIYDHGQLVGGGYTARVSLRHPGTGATYYRETATYSNGVATVTIDEQYAATVAGVTTGYFELLQGSSVKASTADFIVRILPSAEDGAVPGEVYDSAIKDALAELDAATGRISQMVIDATAEYLAAHPEITTTVQDNSVTDAKLIQSGGVLDRVGRLWWRIENLLTATPAESESVTVSDAAQTPVAGLTVYGKSTQDGTPTPDAPVAIESVEPNILRNTASTITVNGITFTVNDDGTVTANGTATANAQLRIDTFVPSDGTYTISGCPANGSSSTYVVRAYTNNGATYAVQDVGEGATFDFVASTHVNLSVYIFVFRNATVNNLTFGPMVARGTKAIREFVPYNGIGLWARGRNLLDESQIVIGDLSSGVVRSGSYEVSGFIPVLPNTTYTASATNGGEIAFYDGSRTYVSRAFTPTFTTPSNCYFVRIEFTQAGNHQLEVGSTAHAYEPYTESVTAIPLDGHTLRSLPDGTRDEVTVDQYGHVTLVQRVGYADTQMLASAINSVVPLTSYVRIGSRALSDAPSPSAASANTGYCNVLPFTGAGYGTDAAHCYTNARDAYIFAPIGDKTTWNTTTAAEWIEEHNVEIVYPLATPVTHDLGTIDPTALVGPDMTAQAVPMAPFALTYERDLNTTLARLEAAIANLA